MSERLIVFVIALAAIPAVQAGGPNVEPGLWEMKSTMSMPMMPQPQVRTQTQCLTEEQLSMDNVGSEEMDPNCTVDKPVIDGDTMTWSFDCPTPDGGQSHGEWQATSYGDHAEGSGKITMSMQGQTMEMTMSWEGKRVGNCP